LIGNFGAKGGIAMNLTIRFVNDQHPTPGAPPPLHQMGRLLSVYITNVDE
jgi:hypothetical protein